jgi:hypothetical protein
MAAWMEIRATDVRIAHAGDHARVNPDPTDDNWEDEDVNADNTVTDMAIVFDQGDSYPCAVLEGSQDELVALWSALTVALAMEGINLPLPENLSAF